METAIRWSQNSVSTNERFLYVDVAGRSIKRCEVTAREKNGIEYHTVSEVTKVPAFRAFDWSPVDEALVAVGQPSGEVTLCKINDEPSQETLSLPIRNQRYCNAIAFNTNGLLASGLDKVRNDSCLNIWDLNQRTAAGGIRSPGSERSSVEPYIRLASSEPITSIKFFPGQPQLLVAGVKQQYVRIYDLREASNNASMQFATRCVHNLAIDARDENFVASCAPTNDATISIWDKRGSGRDSSSSLGYFSGSYGDLTQAALELRRVTDTQGTIWSLRFAKTKRGQLGVMASTGHLKVYETTKAAAPDSESESLQVERIRDVQQPYYHRMQGRDEQNRVVSFDFMTETTSSRGPNIMTLSRDGNIKIMALQEPPPPLLFTSSCHFVHRLESNMNEFEMRSPDASTRSHTIKSMPAMRVRSEERARDNFTTNASKPKLSVNVSEVNQPVQSQVKDERSISQPDLRIEDVLGLSSIQRQRCFTGYRFSPLKNRTLTRAFPQLSAVWSWMENARHLSEEGFMIYNHIDLSYLGAYSLWMEDVGSPLRKRRVGGSASAPPPISRAIEGISRQHVNSDSKICFTRYPAHRRLCLRVCGLLPNDNNIENAIQQLVLEKRATEAAFIALLCLSPKHAAVALRDRNVPEGEAQVNKMLAMAVAGMSRRRRRKHSQHTILSDGSSESSESDTDSWKSLVVSLRMETDDPFALAILSYSLSESWSNVIKEETLPLRYRLNVALRWLPDHELTDFVVRETRQVIDQGKVEGVALTGCGSASAVELMGNYIRRSGDLQTAVLILAHGVPRYVDDGTANFKFEAWKEVYRQAIQSWDLKFERVRFDIESAKLASNAGIKPHKQLSLVCGYCSQSTAHHPPSEDSMLEAVEQRLEGQTRQHRTQRHPLTPEKAAALGTVCPQCGRHLPRCGVCDMWLGMPDTTYLRNTTSDRGGANQESIGGTTVGEESDRKLIEDSHMLDIQTQYQEQKERERKLAAMLWNFVTFCIHCNHGFHTMHALEWFGSQSGFGGLASELFQSMEWQWPNEGRRICPVAECGCVCDRV